MTGRYRPDHRSFGQFMVSARIRNVAISAAEDVAEQARAIVPKDTGNYAAGFRVNRTVAPLSIKGNLRAIAHVYNDDPAAPGQEFGDRWGHKPGRYLRKAGEAVGQVRGADPA